MLVHPCKHILDLLVKVIWPISQIVIKANYKSIQLTKWWQLITTTYVEISKLVILHLLTKTMCNNSTSELCKHVLSYAHISSRCVGDFGKDHMTWCYKVNCWIFVFFYTSITNFHKNHAMDSIGSCWILCPSLHRYWACNETSNQP